jgi:hypothetical protein
MQEYRGKTEEASVGLRSRSFKIDSEQTSDRVSTPGMYRPSILPRTSGPVVPSANPSEREFVAAVSQAMEGSLIRYSKRLELMAMAERMGIGRFQANLLIAQTQQRTGRADEILIRVPEKQMGTDRQDTGDDNRRDKLFLLAALFIISAIVDMVIVKIFFAG